MVERFYFGFRISDFGLPLQRPLGENIRNPQSAIRNKTCESGAAQVTYISHKAEKCRSLFTSLQSIIFTATVFVVCQIAGAQQATPRLGYVCPAGGQQGTTVTVYVGGQYFNQVLEATISGDGVEITSIQFPKPVTQKDFNDAREKIAELQKLPRNAETLAEIAQCRETQIAFLRRPNSPAIADTAILQVKVSPNAAPGRRELRLITPAGISNPLTFNVGQLPEITRPALKGLDDMNQLRALRNGTPPAILSSAPPTDVKLPIILNGQILPSGVDKYRFAATKGQRIVAAASARELMPYIADAVPGWFQANITIYDADGHMLNYAGNFRFSQDPVLCYEIPKDGLYILEIRDSIYRGREDFVYRITLGELPFITGVFPLGGKVGEKTAVELTGWNLPATKLTQDNTNRLAGRYDVYVTAGGVISNSVSFAVDSLPELTALKQSNSRDTAQAITLPVVVNGRIETAGKNHVFRFDGRAGQGVVAEVLARRLGSPMDSVLKLTDSAGKTIAFNDDYEDKGSGLDTHHADSYIRAKLPADGKYYLHVGDAQNQAGPEYAYRLRISEPRHDYDLRIVPSSINVRSGGTIPVTVFALRKDGFDGPITLSLKDAPVGFVLDGATIPAGQDQVRLTMTVPVVEKKPKATTVPTTTTTTRPATAPTTRPTTMSATRPITAPITAPTTVPAESFKLHIEGAAMIDGQAVVRQATPAEDMMQAFAYRHLVPAQELYAALAGRFGGRAAIRIIGTTPVKIPVGGTVGVMFNVPQNNAFGISQLELSDPPEGVTIKSVSPAGRWTEIIFQCDAGKVKPGTKGNLIVNIFVAPKTPASGPARLVANQRRAALGVLPAIPFEIVEK